MHKGQDPLRKALNQFEAIGCDVDYAKLTISGYSKQYLKHTEISIFGEIDEDAGTFSVNCTAYTAYPFSEEAKIFLKQMEDRCAPTYDVDFGWSSPAVFSVIFIKEQLSSYGLVPGFSLDTALLTHFTDCHRFAFSCAHVLNQYGRMKRRFASRRLPRSMNPSGLITFCLADLSDKRLYM